MTLFMGEKALEDRPAQAWGWGLTPGTPWHSPRKMLVSVRTAGLALSVGAYLICWWVSAWETASKFQLGDRLVERPWASGTLFFILRDLEAWQGCCREGGLPRARLSLLWTGPVLQGWQ